MATITDLPPEVFVEICQNISCQDFNSLRQVCKAVNTLGDFYLTEHRKLLREYKKYINRNGRHLPQARSKSLAALLTDIVLTPRFASYLRVFSTYRWERSWERFSALANTERQPVDQRRRIDTNEVLDKDLISAANKKVHLLSEQELKDWRTQVSRGNETPLLAILILLLPCLSTLHLTSIQSFADEFSHSVMHVARNPAFGLLSQLTTVNISFKDDRASLCMVTAFTALPSMKIIRAEGIASDPYNFPKAEAIMPQSSNVTVLSLRTAVIPSQFLLKLFGRCHFLETFEYSVLDSYYGPTLRCRSSESFSSECGRYWRLNEEPACAGSLKRLLLRDYYAARGFSAYVNFFQRFKWITEVDIVFDILLHSRRVNVNDSYEFQDTPRMVDMLPESIQKVTLRYTQEHIQYFAALLEDVYKNKRLSLPNLSRLHFHRLEHFYRWEPRSAEPEEFHGFHDSFPTGSTSYWFERAAVEKCLELGVILTSDPELADVAASQIA